MISARLRYIALALLALAFFGAGVAWLQAGIWPGAVGSLYLSCFCLLGCARIRRTATRRQEEQHRQLEALRTETTPAERCGDRPPPFLYGPPRYSECVLRPGHPGSHADEHNMRWSWIDRHLPPTTGAQQR